MQPSKSRSPLWIALILAVFCCSLGARPVRAGIILTNLPGTGTYGSTGIDLLTSTSWGAVGFQTSSAAESFTSFRGFFTSGTGGQIDGGIYSDNSGNPGSLLAAFTPVTVPASQPAISLTVNTASPFTLQATTNYWVVLHDPIIPYGWDRDNSTNGTTPAASSGHTFNGYRTSINSGTAWSSSTGNWTTEITVATTPEPSTMVLACLAAAGLTVPLLRRRRNGRH